MKLKRCARAYDALVQMKNAKCSYKTAYAMMRLKRELENEVVFLQEKELELAKRCAVLDDHGEIKWTEPGRFRLREDMVAEYHAGMEELNNLDVEITAVKTEKPPETMTMEQAEALDGLLVFEEV